AVLERDAKSPADGGAPGGTGRPKLLAVHDDVARRRPQQADHRPQYGALAAAAAAHHREDGAGTDGKRQVLLYDLGAERERQPFATKALPAMSRGCEPVR